MRIGIIHEFTVLADRLNFSTASRELHVSQSTLSKHINALEDDLGVRLFERDRHTVVLTLHGEEFLEAARIIDTTYAKMKESFHQGKRNETNLLVGGLIDSPGEFSILSQAVQRIQAVYPDRTIHFLPTTTTPLLNHLADNTLDCLVTSFDVNNPHLDIEGKYAYDVVGKLPFYAILSTDHPLANRDHLLLDDLEGQTIIRLSGPRFAAGWQRIQALLSQRHINTEQEFFSALSLNDYMNIDLQKRLFILPRIEMRYHELKNPSRIVIPFVDEEAYFPYGLLYKREQPKLNQIVFLAKTLREIVIEGGEEWNIIP